MNLLIPKLPSPRNDDFSEGILDVIDLDSYQLEAQESMSIKLADEDAEVAPVPAGSAGHIVNPEMDYLSMICSEILIGKNPTMLEDKLSLFQIWLPKMKSIEMQ